MKTECPTCNGNGQISFFKGVSRFLLSVEECHECGGLGFIIDSEDKPVGKTARSNKAGKPRKPK